jgi:hypothetical protein
MLRRHATVSGRSVRFSRALFDHHTGSGPCPAGRRAVAAGVQPSGVNRNAAQRPLRRRPHARVMKSLLPERVETPLARIVTHFPPCLATGCGSGALRARGWSYDFCRLKTRNYRNHGALFHSSATLEQGGSVAQSQTEWRGRESARMAGPAVPYLVRLSRHRGRPCDPATERAFLWRKISSSS